MLSRPLDQITGLLYLIELTSVYEQMLTWQPLMVTDKGSKRCSSSMISVSFIIVEGLNVEKCYQTLSKMLLSSKC